MRQTVHRVAFALILGLVSPLASAQTPPPAPATADAAFAAQKAAFLALPEATRKAAQEALVWLGLYVGVNDGEFGKRTRDAILAFQGNVGAPTDGALSPPELTALLAAAQRARDAAGFQVVSDPKSGARIGAPLKLISARGGARLDFAIKRRRRPRRPLCAPVRGHARPQDHLQGDQAGRLLRRLGAGWRDDVLHPLRQEPGGDPAHPRLHLRLSGVTGRLSQPGRDRGRQFIRALPRIRAGANRERDPRHACVSSGPPSSPSPPRPRSSSRPARR